LLNDSKLIDKGETPEERMHITLLFIIIILTFGFCKAVMTLHLSGPVKTYDNLFVPELAYQAILTATWLYNVSFLLFILAFIPHTGAILLKPNLPMARGSFTGYVRLDYAGDRRPLWYARVKKATEPSRRERLY
jgi:hypothetical protein